VDSEVVPHPTYCSNRVTTEGSQPWEEIVSNAPEQEDSQPKRQQGSAEKQRNEHERSIDR
jgi:hypothetical protein